MTLYTDVNDNYLAVQVTLENMEAVARWCKGSLRQRNIIPPIIIYPPLTTSNPAETTIQRETFIMLYKDGDEYEAQIGDWIILRMGKAGKAYYDVYSNEDFHDLYREV